MVDALVLAGGTSKGLEKEGEQAKASIRINKKLMLEYVIASLRNSTSVRRIAVVGPPALQDKLRTARADIFLPASDSLTKNMSLGLAELNSLDPVLITSSDIPLVTPEAIDDFVSRCEKVDADICYSVVDRERIEKFFPGVKRTYATFREGTFTGGNVGLVNPKVVRENMELIEKAFGLRKSPVRLLRILGLRFVLKFIFHRLTLGEVEQRVSLLLNSRGRAVVTPYPQIGIDVDKMSDLELARRFLQSGEEEKS
jgi:GTP:adenosylcobinamide-phosphate guanylyltransferase